MIELARDLISIHAEDRAIQIYIFAAGKIRMKTGAHSQQRSGLAVEMSFADRRTGDAGENFQQRRFACSVRAHDADDFAWINFEVDVL